MGGNAEYDILKRSEKLMLKLTTSRDHVAALCDNIYALRSHGLSIEPI